tara:strand:- start:5551 stop:6591 length:1041 start_codon:yes stop_codon:yes gene_type:complete
MSNFATGRKSKAISDRSGMEFPYTEMRKEWNGAFVHESEFEPKHPQLEPKVQKGDAQGLQNARPDRVEPPVAHMLGLNAFSSGARDSIIVNVNDPGHGFVNGDVVRFRNTQGKLPPYPEVSHLEGHDLDVAQGHVVTKIDNDNFSFSPNDTLTKFLDDNCNPGTTTVFVDMDGVLSEYYNAVADYATSVGLLESGGDWYGLTPAIEQAAVNAGGATFFSDLAKRAEADALVDLVIAKNGSYQIISDDTGVSSFNTAKQNWVNTNFTGARAPTGNIVFHTLNAGATFALAGPNKLLIDDRTFYINLFETNPDTGAATGGKGFKYYESGGILKFGGGRSSVGPVTVLA